MKQVWEILLVATRLGLTSFGGPIAHIGYFREEYVVRRRWLSDARFAELVALCQFLPGPASSQLGIAIGYGRAGYLGALLAWLGFTLPSAAAMILFAYGVTEFGGEDAGCCYAEKTETWLADPDGARWEWYVKSGDAEQIHNTIVRSIPSDIESESARRSCCA